jgi:hypothetical protein
MSDIFIVTTPAFGRTGKRKHERFDTYLRDTGELICIATRQPLLDASRVLLARGYDPKDVICKVTSEAPQIVTMRAIIGIAAQYDVMGEKFVRRKAAGPDASAVAAAAAAAAQSLVLSAPAPANESTAEIISVPAEARQTGTKSKTKAPREEARAQAWSGARRARAQNDELAERTKPQRFLDHAVLRLRWNDDHASGSHLI